jgi:hypothetical protein
MIDKMIDEMVYEAKARLHWYIDGIGQHGLSSELFSSLSTERIVEIYNIEMKYFRPCHQELVNKLPE